MSTERPSAIEIGMPHAIRREQQRKQQLGAHRVRQLDDVQPGGEADQRERNRDDDDQRRGDRVAERPRRGGFDACEKAIIRAAPLTGAGASCGAS